MKYMGSKRAMLTNGLGNLLQAEVATAARFVDLFTGSGSVANHVAQRYPVAVLATDLQEYGAVLAQAVIGRTRKVDAARIWSAWYARAAKAVKRRGVPRTVKVTKAFVLECRAWSAARKELPITQAYGGHYYSPEQALWIDALRATLPRNEPDRTVALAALIQVASQCATAPGHTAQPLQPTKTAKPFFDEIWSWDIPSRVGAAFKSLSTQHAQQVGEAYVADANDVANELREGDLVFIDPPYSAVHYSRFYHVLETIALGEPVEVTGIGRYPAIEFRPTSQYSLLSQAGVALDDLLGKVAENGARAIVTFPDHDCSNGLSGREVVRIASKYFHVWQEVSVDSRFSTMGGTSSGETAVAGRDARHDREELMIVLNPRRAPR